MGKTHGEFKDGKWIRVPNEKGLSKEIGAQNIIQKYAKTANAVKHGLELSYAVNSGRILESALTVEDRCDIIISAIGMRTTKMVTLRAQILDGVKTGAETELEEFPDKTVQELLGDYLAEPKWQFLMKKLNISEAELAKICKDAGAK
mgnify:CR=1 FL=1